jgi:heterodisulfide reductase subunit A
MKKEHERRIGVYVCHCGGNISDYVDVERVVEAIKDEPGVVVARTAMFTCSDATQAEMAQDIEEQGLDGLVVASCSPKLHTFTFRGVARRAHLNPYQYTQVNIREQCSWAHTDDREGATEKAIRLVRAGIARTRLTEPLDPTVVETVPKALVIGAGITGLRAALALADIGIAVYVVEKAPEPGGWVARFGEMYPNGREGREIIEGLLREVRARENVVLFTNAEVTRKAGSFGNHEVDVHVAGEHGGSLRLTVGSIIVATGFDTYQPEPGEYGYGAEGVLTLPEFKELIDRHEGGPLEHHGRPVRNIVYIYCVGSRQHDGRPNAHRYCSRYCCTATVHAALEVAAKVPGVHQYHLYRDIRTYGRYELLWNESREKGSLYLKFDEEAPPAVAIGADGQLRVSVRDTLTSDKELTIPADLVVLVTGMVPRQNDELVRTLKLPVGRDGFYNEIHPKLRPVETVVDGVYICGTCQGPKNAAESVASGLAAAAQSAAILKPGRAELDPQVAEVDEERCTWCGLCAEACPYGAISQVEVDGKSVAHVESALCKGCGGCVPVCPEAAIDVRGYTQAELTAMVDALAKEVV